MIITDLLPFRQRNVLCLRDRTRVTTRCVFSLCETRPGDLRVGLLPLPSISLVRVGILSLGFAFSFLLPVASGGFGSVVYNIPFRFLLTRAFALILLRALPFSMFRALLISFLARRILFFSVFFPTIFSYAPTPPHVVIVPIGPTLLPIIARLIRAFAIVARIAKFRVRSAGHCLLRFLRPNPGALPVLSEPTSVSHSIPTSAVPRRITIHVDSFYC